MRARGGSSCQQRSGWSSRRRGVAIGLLGIAGLLTGGCGKPSLEGPQLEGFVKGFAVDRGCSVARVSFPNEKPVEQRCFIRGWNRDQPECWITISRFDGTLDRDRFEAGRSAAEEKRGGCHEKFCREFGPMQTLEIGGREGFGYIEVSRTGDRIDNRELHAAVNWDEITTYTIDINGVGPEYRTEAALEAAAARFVVVDGRSMLHWQVGIGLLALVGGWLTWQRITSLRERTERQVKARTFVTPRGSVADRRPPLLDAGPRVQALRRHLESQPDLALVELEALRDGHAPNQHVLHALALGYTTCGRRDRAVEIAAEAFPLLFERGCYNLAIEVWKALGPRDGAASGLSATHRKVLAAAMLDASDWQAAQPLYEALVAENPADEEASTGLLLLAERHLEPAGLAGEAAEVAMFVRRVAPADRPARERAERLLSRTAPFVRS